MERLKTTAALVKSVLENDPKSRNSDCILYLNVLKICGERNGIDVKTMTVSDFLLQLKENGFPPFESVRRTRQKIQAEYPELKSKPEIQAIRAEQEKEYRAFALERSV